MYSGNAIKTLPYVVVRHVGKRKDELWEQKRQHSAPFPYIYSDAYVDSTFFLSLQTKTLSFYIS